MGRKASVTSGMVEEPNGPWADARRIDNLEDCYFYQTVDLPTHGLQLGEWDLRGNVDVYLGSIALDGKRVLELGTANGFLCFEMESRGAEVVGFDLGEDCDWDLVPYGGAKPSQAERHEISRRLHNAWWLAHSLVGSAARVCYGNVYEIPTSLGEFDVVTAGSILLHLRDPFAALEQAAAAARSTVVVTDQIPVLPRRSAIGALQLLRRFNPRLADRLLPDLIFLPDAAKSAPTDTWWRISPELVCRILRVLGFSHQTVTYHQQMYNYPVARLIPMYTVVASRQTPDECAKA
jgi:SAM-dependent methyltransferase